MTTRHEVKYTRRNKKQGNDKYVGKYKILLLYILVSFNFLKILVRLFKAMIITLLLCS